MGFFRTGKLWSIEHFGVKPDIIVFGKALTNGLNPLSGVWAREELINPTVFPPGSTHSTFASNPLGTAVGLEAMKLMHEEGFAASIMEKGAYFLNVITLAPSLTITKEEIDLGLVLMDQLMTRVMKK